MGRVMLAWVGFAIGGLVFPGAAHAALILNGNMESNSGNGSTLTSWTKIPNSYGAYNGGGGTMTAYRGTWMMHVGDNYAGNGEYQDFATMPGQAYQLAFWAVGFDSSQAAAIQQGMVQLGTSGNTSQYLNNSYSVPQWTAPSSWTRVDGSAYQFTAQTASTRLTFLNNLGTGPLPGGNGYAVNVDDVSVALVLPELNSGFETNTGTGGDATDWHKWVAGTSDSYGTIGEPHSGSWAYHVGANSAGHGMFQDIATVPGQDYMLEFWAVGFSGSGLKTDKGAVAVGDPLYGEAGGTAGADNFYNNAYFKQDFLPLLDYSETAPEHNYQQFFMQFTAQGAVTRLALYNYLGGAVQADDVSIAPVIPEPSALVLVGQAGAVLVLGALARRRQRSRRRQPTA